MERRKFIRQTAGFGIAVHPLVKSLGAWVPQASALPVSGKLTGPGKPVFVYNNWSAYDELSDKVVQTEALAMRELDEVIRLRANGVQIDYYVMDAFWFDKCGGYRTWHKEHWPDGPDKWLNACHDNHLKPGMWFSSNLIATHDGRFLEPVPEWKDAVATDPNILCLFEGGYLPHLADTLQIWYDRGVRIFKFDFAYFEAVTATSKERFTPDEIKEKNRSAFMHMLQQFRARNEDVLLTGYNGFGGDMENTVTPFKKTVDDRWLDTFDTLYCGDPRFSDVPMMNAWRSQDTYSDHMVRQFAFNGLPLRRIDNCAFMIGTTGTCYYRGDHAWKGMLILELARGGWMNVYHGNLELLDQADAQWFARAQQLYHSLQQQDDCITFGAIPGTGQPYGYKAGGGAVFTVVNPSQSIMQIALPMEKAARTRIIYADAGFVPVVDGHMLTLGAEQLVVVGTGAYADPTYDLGIDRTIRIPFTQQKVGTTWTPAGKNVLQTILNAIPGKDLRIVLQQFDAAGLPIRSWGGAPPDGRKMDTLIKIKVTQDGREVPLMINYDKMIWSGLSWAVGELQQSDFEPTRPLECHCSSMEKDTVQLKAAVYAVGYAPHPGQPVSNLAPLKDTDGHLINAHGAGVLFHEGTYYLYGEIKKGTTRLVPGQSWEDYRVDAGGVSCYSSRDLRHWKYEGIALIPQPDDPGSDLHTSKVQERPKVVYNRTTGKFVMWLHVDHEDYSYARAGVATSDRPEGPFQYLSSVRPNGQMSRDMTLFRDNDDKAYLVYTSENNATMHVCLLSDDYLAPTPQYKRILIGQKREAPAVFSHEGKYYLITSLCTGWDPNAATYAVSDSMMGNWEQQGNPCTGPDADMTYHSQSSFVLPLQGQKGDFLFMADRWNKTDLERSDYLWLPLYLEKGRVKIRGAAI